MVYGILPKFINVYFHEYQVQCIDVQIENNRLHFRERAQSKCGSLDFIDHVPGGGDKLVWSQLTVS